MLTKCQYFYKKKLNYFLAIVCYTNNINNNSGYGIHSDSASENEIFSNDLSYNSDISLYLEATDNSTIHNNTFIGI